MSKRFLKSLTGRPGRTAFSVSQVLFVILGKLVVHFSSPCRLGFEISHAPIIEFIRANSRDHEFLGSGTQELMDWQMPLSRMSMCG